MAYFNIKCIKLSKSTENYARCRYVLKGCVKACSFFSSQNKVRYEYSVLPLLLTPLHYEWPPTVPLLSKQLFPKSLLPYLHSEIQNL